MVMWQLAIFIFKYLFNIFRSMILSWIVARRAQWCVLLWLREHTDTRAQCASKLYVTKRSHRSRKRTWKTNYKHTVNGFSSLFTFKALKFMLMPVFTSAHRSNFITWSIKALFLSITNECRWSFFFQIFFGFEIHFKCRSENAYMILPCMNECQQLN